MSIFGYNNKDLMKRKESVKKYEEKLQYLIGFVGTVEDIEFAISRFSTNEPVEISLEEENEDICFVFNLGMDGTQYLDFDLFVIETDEEHIFRIVEIKSIG